MPSRSPHQGRKAELESVNRHLNGSFGYSTTTARGHHWPKFQAEPEDDGVDGADGADGADGVVDAAGADSVDGVDEVDPLLSPLSDELELPPLLSLLLLAELYKSEYQPPPLRMNPVPREIWRRAVS